jgi:hypothetical protein
MHEPERVNPAPQSTPLFLVILEFSTHILSAILKIMEKVKIVNQSVPCGFWFAAWMFTIGILDLNFWQGVWAIIIWPYYLGHALTAML